MPGRARTASTPAPHPEPAPNPETGPDLLGVIESATAVLMRNLELLGRRSDTYTDLDRSEYLLLRALEHTGPADIGTLAGALGLDPSTAARQVAAMQTNNLVTRTLSCQDRRCMIIAPTAEGQRLTEATRQRRLQSTAHLLDGWNFDDLHTLGRMFTRYNQAVAHAYLTPPATRQPSQPLAALDPTDGPA